MVIRIADRQERGYPVHRIEREQIPIEFVFTPSENGANNDARKKYQDASATPSQRAGSDTTQEHDKKPAPMSLFRRLLRFARSFLPVKRG